MTTGEDSATGLSARLRLPWWLPVLAAAYAGYYGLLLYGDLALEAQPLSSMRHLPCSLVLAGTLLGT